MKLIVLAGIGASFMISVDQELACGNSLGVVAYLCWVYFFVLLMLGANLKDSERRGGDGDESRRVRSHPDFVRNRLTV